ncbi:hypothetical protein BDK51DRAFT_50273, partial [Blyttiomyces helicus]
MELRKICGHPYLLQDVEPTNLTPAESHARLIDSSSKLDLLHRMLAKLRARGHRVLIFSQFKLILNIIEDYVVAEGFPYCRLVGLGW